jgi:hypothetical protein
MMRVGVPDDRQLPKIVATEFKRVFRSSSQFFRGAGQQAEEYGSNMFAMAEASDITTAPSDVLKALLIKVEPQREIWKINPLGTTPGSLCPIFITVRRPVRISRT